MSTRGRRAVLRAVLALAIVGAALAGAAWYVLGEARRTGRLVAAVLSARTGLPITVARAATDGARLRLWDVRVAASPAAPLELRVREVDVAGGVLPLVAPAGRRLAVVAVAASVRVGDGAGGPAGGAALESIRALLRALLDWPGALTLRVEDGELPSLGGVQRFTLNADKGSATLAFTLTLAPPSAPPALTVNVRATARDAGGVGADVDLAGAPPRLRALWPGTLPAPAHLAARSEVRLARGGDLTASGRMTLGDTGSPPAVLDFASRYDAARNRLGVSRYALAWGSDVHLAGDAEATVAVAGATLAATGRGTVDGSPVSGRATWELGTGAFQGEVTVDSLDARQAARRLGVGALPQTLTARRLAARFAGHAAGSRPTVTVALRADAVTVPAAPAFPVAAALDARVILAGARPAAVEDATLTLARGGRTLALARASSRGAGLWPLTLDIRLEDLAHLGPAFPGEPALTGWARVAGEVRWGERPEFHGTLEAQLPRAQLAVGGPVALTDVRALVPVASAGGASEGLGSVTVARVVGWGVTLTDLTSTARLRAWRLLLSDIHYAQYGGRGRGWLEAALDGGPTPSRARLEGQGVDLATFVRQSGWQVGRITGRVRYVAAAQYERPGGFVAAVRLDSEGDGGEVSIDAIERLLESATVQAETTGVLRQTLENLRVFPYESLEGDLRVHGRAGFIDLSLRGRKRLGIFPAPVEAINFRNVPLSVLARTLQRSSP